ncbi:MAG TPA: CDP-glucose 4,6-dehydratase [Puia sp.]
MADEPGKMENMVREELLRFFSNKKVFVTGNTGFKGSWLSAILHELNVDIKGYALEPEYENGLFKILEPLKISANIFADIRNRNLLLKEIESFQPDYIFHLAAQPLVRRSYQIPAETFDVNVTGTANLLEAISKLKKKITVVVITTDKVYTNLEIDLPHKETDLLGGYDPYSASKACTEFVVNAFRNSFFNPKKYNEHKKKIVTARAGNVIGGGDWSADRIIPDIVKAFSDNKTVDIRNPEAVRPWQHVLEPLYGYLLLAGLLHNTENVYADSYNFGPLPDDHLTVRNLLEIILQNWNGAKWNDVSQIDQPHETKILKLDIANAKTQLGWTPKLKASEAIQWTMNWYKQPLTKQSEYTFEQINNYFAL